MLEIEQTSMQVKVNRISEIATLYGLVEEEIFLYTEKVAKSLRCIISPFNWKPRVVTFEKIIDF